MTGRRGSNRRKWAPGTTYSFRSAMRELKITQSTLDKAIANGDIKTFEFGGRVLIPASEIERLKPLLVGGVAT